MIKISTCKICKKEFSYPTKDRKGIYCTTACYRSDKEAMRMYKLGKPRPQYVRDKLSESRKGKITTRDGKPMVGENHPNWVGDKVSYKSLHNWLERNYGKAKKFPCDFCGEERKMNWANLDGNYTRDRGTWAILCMSCHRRFDFWILPYIKIGFYSSNLVWL